VDQLSRQRVRTIFSSPEGLSHTRIAPARIASRLEGGTGKAELKFCPYI